jgi:hypothetical protein
MEYQNQGRQYSYGRIFRMVECWNILSLDYIHLQSTRTYPFLWQKIKNFSKIYSSPLCQKKLLLSFVNLTSLSRHYLKMKNLTSGLIYEEMVNSQQKKCYNLLIGSQPFHPTIKWVWKSHCQAKHKVFYCLLLNDRLNTRALLTRKNMILDSYTCELCILQKEKLRHLFYRCSFAKRS